VDLHWVDRLGTMEIDKVQVVVEIFMHVTYCFEIFSREAFIDCIKEMLFVELRTVNSSNFLFYFFILFLDDFILHNSHLIFRPLIHLHLCLFKAI
jgi:hypothetical protein